jgi:hypothetical protein
MKTRFAVLVGGVLVALSAVAGANDPISELANQTGLRDREVKMVLGKPTSYAEYRTSYLRAKHTLKAPSLNERSQAVIERNQREIDRAVEIAMRYSVAPRAVDARIASAP